jgi:F-type H+-transporting ATPase subunit gamma
MIDNLLAQRLIIFLYQALLEGAASEHGSRMSAMDSATNNASEVRRKLTLEYNRARQAAITSELIEIISGAEAL